MDDVYFEIVKLLCSHVADIYATDHHNDTPIAAAALAKTHRYRRSLPVMDADMDSRSHGHEAHVPSTGERNSQRDSIFSLLAQEETIFDKKDPNPVVAARLQK